MPPDWYDLGPQVAWTDPGQSQFQSQRSGNGSQSQRQGQSRGNGHGANGTNFQGTRAAYRHQQGQQQQSR